MITVDQALNMIPGGLRKPLIDEYTHIVRNYMERRWAPSELSGGKFCEIVYTILDGFAAGSYASTPIKPQNFHLACRALESNTSSPRSFQILIPRILPALYEIRNNRGVGHVGGDVNPNHIDATAVLSITSWIMAELIRVFHDIAIEDAQKIADSIVERRVPLVWQSGETRRVLRPDLSLRNQILLLLSSSSSPVSINSLFRWTECSNRTYFNKLLRDLHSSRYIELASDASTAELLPPGWTYVDQLTTELTQPT